MVEIEDGRLGLRRVVASSSAVLLLMGGAVGAAVAGLPNGKHVGKGPIAQVFAKKPPATLPPATVTTTPRSGAPKTTPLASSKNPVKPAPIHKASASSGSSTGSSAGGSSSTSTGGSTSTGSGNKNKNKPHKPKPTPKPKPKGPTVFAAGEQPQSAGLLASGPSDNPGDVSNLIDYESVTSWSATRSGVGVWVQPSNSPYAALGIVSLATGYKATLYYTTSSTVPSDLSGWTKIRDVTVGKKKRKVNLPAAAGSATYYLLVLDTGLPVKLAEIELLH